MDEDKEALQFNLRYAQRLCQRTARFYRRIQSMLTFISLLAGSSTVAARLSDTSEVEPLRAVAYNDVVLEIDEPDAIIPLTGLQKLMGALA